MAEMGLIEEGCAPELPKYGTNKFTKADYDGSRMPIIRDHVAEARFHCENGVEQLKHEQFREAARDRHADMTFFGQRPESSRTGIPLDKPLGLKQGSEQEKPQKKEFRVFRAKNCGYRRQAREVHAYMKKSPYFKIGHSDVADIPHLLPQRCSQHLSTLKEVLGQKEFWENYIDATYPD